MKGPRIDAYCECSRPLPVGDGCSECREFRCADCHRVTPWDFGAADEWFEFCDDCAVKRMQRGAA